MITPETLKTYLTKLNTVRLEKIYMQIYFMLEERERKVSEKKKTTTAKVDTACIGS
tara:strand:- start:1393 stop:1560 length:168 start_codon:yes stop_codon:yes gene_type:complete